MKVYDLPDIDVIDIVRIQCKQKAMRNTEDNCVERRTVHYECNQIESDCNQRDNKFSIQFADNYQLF